MWTTYLRRRKPCRLSPGAGIQAARRADRPCLARSLAVAAAIALLLFATRPVAAQDRGVPVDLELIIAVDVSGSIDEDEARLQRDGYLAAFTDEEVIGAITGGMLGKISVTYVEWAGAHYATTIVDWRLIDSRASAEAFAKEVARAPLQTALWTSISRAIEYVLPKFDGNGFEGTRRVIDISGDGPNNQGGLVTGFRDKAIAAGVTINGLPIVNDKPSPWGWPPLPDLDLYYASCVIGGSGAFYVVANTFSDFARAVRQKLLLEIAGRTPPRFARERVYRVAAQDDNRTPPPCDIGERRVQWLLDEQ